MEYRIGTDDLSEKNNLGSSFNVENSVSFIMRRSSLDIKNTIKRDVKTPSRVAGSRPMGVTTPTVARKKLGKIE